MSTKTRFTIPTQKAPRSTEPAPSRREATGPVRDGRRAALAAISVLLALAAAATVLYFALSGSESTTPAPNNEPFISQLPSGIDGSDARLYQDGPVRGVPPLRDDTGQGPTRPGLRDIQ